MDGPVVTGTDGSAAAWAAVEWAAAEARLHGRPLRVVHALHVARYEHGLRVMPPPHDLLHQAGERILAGTLDRLRDAFPGLEVSRALSADMAAATLAEEAVRAFEVVVGHEGHGKVTDLVLGSVGLGASGHCPVVIVRGRAAHPCREIVVAVDPARDCSAELAYGFREASAHGALLRVLHVVALSHLLRSGSEAPAPPLADAWHAIRRVLAPWRGRYPAVRLRADVVQGIVVPALLGASLGADLLVVGLTPPQEQAVPGPRWTHRDLISRVHCPLALVSRRRDAGL
ncbi:universal stress protein [Bailinhaonella thermotolerans]|uniref:universal stress protein n=1 Tax=Bailinhaonella thermotolerans TaxID=1070861 RepID=UPI00192A2F97|nr:universal stress protein [Bailinhaonella thermotolerans]